MGVKEQLAHMREQLVELQEKMKTRVAEFNAERESIQEIIDGNIARVNCIKMSPSWSEPEVQEVVKSTERDNAKARHFFQRTDEKLMHHTLQVQQFVDYIKYLETMQDASYAFAM